MTCKTLRLLAALTLLSVWTPRPALAQEAEGEPPVKRRDVFGDTLADQVDARLGTWRLKHRGTVLSLDFSGDGRLLASAGSDGWAIVWFAKHGGLHGYDNAYDFKVYSVDLNQDGSRVAVADGGGILKILDLEAKSVLHTIRAHTDSEDTPINQVVFSPDGQLVATACDSGSVKVWDVSSGTLHSAHGSEAGEIGQWTVAFLDDGKALVAGGSDGKLRFYSLTRDPEGAGELREPLECGGAVNSVAVSPDGTLLAAGDRGNQLGVWAWPGGGKVREIVHELPVQTVSFSPDGQVMGALTQSALLLYDVKTGEKASELRDLGALTTFTFAPDSKFVAIGAVGRAIAMVTLADHQVLLGERRHLSAVTAVGIAAGGKLAASTGADGRTLLWNLETAAVTKVLAAPGAPPPLADVALLGDGRTVATLCAEPAQLAVWDVATGKLLREVPVAGFPIDLAATRDGKLVACSGGAKAALAGLPPKPVLDLIDPTTGAVVRDLEPPVAPSCVAFSPDGKEVLASAGKQVLVWSTASGERARAIDVGVQLDAMALDGSGKLLVTYAITQEPMVTEPAAPEEGEGAAKPEEEDPARAGGGARAGLPEGGAGGLIDSPVVHQPAPRAPIKPEEPEPVEPELEEPESEEDVELGPPGTVLSCWDFANGEKRWQMRLEKVVVRSLALSPDGSLLAVGTDDWNGALYDLESGTAVAHFAEHEGPVTCVAFTPDGQHLISGSTDTTLLVWNVARLREQK